MKFEKVSGSNRQIRVLYDLLQQRKHRISHRGHITIDEHKEFVLHHPYMDWYIIYVNNTPIGSFYTKSDNSIGLNLVRQDKKTLLEIITFIRLNLKPKAESPSLIPRYFYINTPQSNSDLQRLLGEIGLLPIQVSYRV
jgi:hypothetical protein